MSKSEGRLMLIKEKREKQSSDKLISLMFSILQERDDYALELAMGDE